MLSLDGTFKVSLHPLSPSFSIFTLTLMEMRFRTSRFYWKRIIALLRLESGWLSLVQLISNDKMIDLVARPAKKTHLEYRFFGSSTLSDSVFLATVIPSVPLIAGNLSRSEKKVYILRM